MMSISQLRVLIVCSKTSGRINPFIQEQIDSLKTKGLTIDYFTVDNKGIAGYLKEWKPLRSKIKKGDYDLVHAHYGLSGLLANLQRIIPVITTYHGSDVHYRFNRGLSHIASRLSAFNILTNRKQINQLHLNSDFEVIPCGVNMDLFHPMDKVSCREKIGFNASDKIILFSSSFDRKVKNPVLAKKAARKIQGVRLIELKGYTREEVVILINAANVVLVTSFYETGPLIIKEAMACGTPIISTDVGDAKEVIKNTDNCFITKYDSKDIANKIDFVINQGGKTMGRNVVQQYDLPIIADKVKDVYLKVLSK